MGIRMTGGGRLSGIGIVDSVDTGSETTGGSVTGAGFGFAFGTAAVATLIGVDFGGADLTTGLGTSCGKGLTMIGVLVATGVGEGRMSEGSTSSVFAYMSIILL